ncbi:Ribosomal RNA small subunit methyltransferase D [Marinomonas gallaica]|uniref:Ribosomal RNA small subunit methyltransferase D n=1 Tax=Marinomonas gallaica TaxID=1806667 RepID=A0A1C3JQH0_9GAMM|nr:16S rRNA (guanine(966)-N(2))-methyltransferase RsmD [Marinomonas gallaica]SBT17290.1 Ribosomal RNA small subunit methyltransferase D [Marinomonas gallaica]SBT22266.1 Ribosomal RNA small subunit methyltransferase D [Marinomonas gallaica]
MRKPTKANNAKGQSKLRIIGGDWRSRQLPILDLDGLRPTTDRVRETVFNWLNFDIPGASCLDLFAGSGALGLEALSRGAKECTFVELNRAVAQQITHNLTTLKASNGSVINSDAMAYLNTPPTAFDIIFLDPPFRKGLLEKIIPMISEGWLKPNGYIYIEKESESDLSCLPNHWQLEKEKRAGQLTYSLYKVIT